MSSSIGKELPRVDGIESPPRTLGATLARLGPGIIIAGSIVGSGELIATTKVGAEAGFWLLWLILIGCVIKVFAQVELGRYTLIHRETPLAALNSLPGPRWRVNWLIWCWVFVTLLVMTQQGGIVGGVGQALSISFPLTQEGTQSNKLEKAIVKTRIELAQKQRFDGTDAAGIRAVQEELDSQLERLKQRRADAGEPLDVYLWSTLLAIVTSILLYLGHYHFIQLACIVFVGSFTLMTVATVGLLQYSPPWQITAGDIVQGLSFRLPPADVARSASPLSTALFAFGIIGVGAVELIAYPYWCLEKGYARFTGKADGSDAWVRRVQGWMRVLRLDAWSFDGGLHGGDGSILSAGCRRAAPRWTDSPERRHDSDAIRDVRAGVWHLGTTNLFIRCLCRTVLNLFSYPRPAWPAWLPMR